MVQWGLRPHLSRTVVVTLLAVAVAVPAAASGVADALADTPGATAPSRSRPSWRAATNEVVEVLGWPAGDPTCGGPDCAWWEVALTPEGDAVTALAAAEHELTTLTSYRLGEGADVSGYGYAAWVLLDRPAPLRIVVATWVDDGSTRAALAVGDHRAGAAMPLPGPDPWRD